MSSYSKIGIAVAAVLGIALIVFGSVWLGIFSRFEKIPADLERTVELEGTFVVVDEAHLRRLQTNPVVQQLATAPGTLELLSDPGIFALLANPVLSEVLADAAIVSVLTDPEALALLGNPTVLGLLANKDVMELLQDPAFIAALGDPAALAQFASDPRIGPLLANQAVIALLANPALPRLLGSGVVATLAARPEILGLLREPALAKALSNPAVPLLLAEPDAMKLLLDPRTQTVLANPADLPIITVPVVLHRERRAVATDPRNDANKIVLRETVEYRDPDTGLGREIPGLENSEATLIIDRSTKEYLPGTDGGRNGQFGLPFHIDKDQDYATWITAAGKPMVPTFQRTEEVDGLETYVYVLDVTSDPLGAADPVTGLPLVLDALITVWVEPVTGSIVNAEDFDAISAIDPAGQKYPRLVADLRYTDATVEELTRVTDGDRNKILWFGTNMPWMSIGLGIFLIVVAGGGMGFLAGRTRR